MHPVLFESPRITSYGALLLAALVAGWAVARRRARGEGIDPGHVDRAAPLLVVAGLAGAFAFERIGGGPGEARALYGALLLAVAAGIAYALSFRIVLGPFGDMFAPAMAVGIAVGRIGCLLSGCCFGATCGLPGLPAVAFPAGTPAHAHHVALGLVPPLAARSLPVHPVQAYESLGALLLAALSIAAARRRRVPGEGFLAFGIGYGLLRLGLEPLRGDAPPSLSRWTAVVTILLCMALFVARRRLFGRPPEPAAGDGVSPPGGPS